MPKPFEVLPWVVFAAGCLGTASGPLPSEDEPSTPSPAIETGPAPIDDTGSGTAIEDASSTDPAVDGAAPPEDAAADAPAAETSTPPPGTIPVFVAQGHMGRTILSCDRGATWVGNRSDDDALRCFSPTDCDHNGGRAMGIAFGDGWYVATWGWGQGNSVRRSEDGFGWERVLDKTVFSGVEFAGRKFAAISGQPRVSSDDGKTWQAVPSIGFKGHIRATGSVDFGGGRFVAAGSENGSSTGEVMISSDGTSWKRPAQIDPACALAVGWNSIAHGGGVFVIVSENGKVCRSEDGGERFTTHETGGKVDATLHDGTQFVAYGAGNAYRSKDGKSWTTTKLTLEGGGSPSFGAAAHGAGRYVAVNGGWQVWYEKQVFYASDDGIAWKKLPPGAFVGSHPITQIAFGNVKKPSICK
jgi:hypothetical protein